MEIYTRQLHYYFYTLVLLFIPLLFKVIMFILTDIGPRMLVDLNKLVIRDTMETAPEITINHPSGLKKVKVIGIKLAPEYADINLDFFMHTFYNPMLFMEGHMIANIKPLYAKINLASLYFYYFMQALGFGYILFFFI